MKQKLSELWDFIIILLSSILLPLISIIYFALLITIPFIVLYIFIYEVYKIFNI